MEKTKEYLRQVNPKIHIIEANSTDEHGLDQWYDWLLFKRTHQLTT
jgi:Ni2+-binding GTPase involved in maturation of urease and hydrogenase